MRHVLLVGLLVLYCTLGGLLFLRLEQAHEVAALRENLAQLERLSQETVLTLCQVLNTSSCSEAGTRDAALFAIK